MKVYNGPQRKSALQKRTLQLSDSYDKIRYNRANKLIENDIAVNERTTLGIVIILANNETINFVINIIY